MRIIEHEDITFTLVRSKVKNINLRISHNGTVRISAPSCVPISVILEFVYSNREWINKHRNKLYLKDNEFFYLGELHYLSELGTKSLDDFYSQTSVKVLTEQYNKLSVLITSHPPILKIEPMKGKYGYYDRLKHEIHLNSQLIMVPLKCIDLVIAHELVHTIYFNHSKEFHAELQRLIPNEKELRNELSRYILW